MTGFVIKRICQAVFVLLVTGLIAFFMFRFVGDPVENLVGQDKSIKDIELLKEKLGLERPVVVQYFNFLLQAVQGDFGISYRQGRPVAEIIGERLPATLELVFVSAMFAAVCGITLGVHCAVHPNSPISRILMGSSLIGVSLPTFLVGILAIYVFAIKLNWLPSSGRGQVVQVGSWSSGLFTLSGLKSLILPSITLGLYQLALIARLVRAQMLEVLESDYIRFARARGLSESSIRYRHGFKNVLNSLLTICGLQLGIVVAFSAVTETVFQWPGVGLMFINSIQFVDIPVMATYLMLVALMFVAINLVVDLICHVLDPRLRLSGVREV